MTASFALGVMFGAAMVGALCALAVIAGGDPRDR